MQAAILAPRLRQFLVTHFPDSAEVPASEITGQIVKLIDEAKVYQMRSEYDLQAYVSAAWLLGLRFDRDFPRIAEVLNDFGIASFEKAEFLWNYCEEIFGTLEGKEETGKQEEA